MLRPAGVTALTATASRAVVEDIRATLRIPAEGVWIGSWDRPNLKAEVLRAASDEGAGAGGPVVPPGRHGERALCRAGAPTAPPIARCPW